MQNHAAISNCTAILLVYLFYDGQIEISVLIYTFGVLYYLVGTGSFLKNPPILSKKNAQAKAAPARDWIKYVGGKTPHPSG